MSIIIFQNQHRSCFLALAAVLPPQVADSSFLEAGFGEVSLESFNMGAGSMNETSVALSAETDATARSEYLNMLTSTSRFEKVVPYSSDKQHLWENLELLLGYIHISDTDGQLHRSDNRAGFDQGCAKCELSASSSLVTMARIMVSADRWLL